MPFLDPHYETPDIQILQALNRLTEAQEDDDFGGRVKAEMLPLSGTTYGDREGTSWTYWRFWPKRLSDEQAHAIPCNDAGGEQPGSIFHREPVLLRGSHCSLWYQAGGYDI